MVGTNKSAAALVARIKSHKALAGILGLGYVGLPLALRFSQAGFKVIGWTSTKPKRLPSTRARATSDPAVAAARAAALKATTDFSRAAEADALIICVPTEVAALF